MEEIINIQGCPKHYLEPDSVELSFDPVRQGCSDVYSSADLLLSTTCRGLNESQNCVLDLHDSLHNNPECFRINELVIEYSCEGIFLIKFQETIGFISCLWRYYQKYFFLSYIYIYTCHQYQAN